jgi:oxalate---CoA ligase
LLIQEISNQNALSASMNPDLFADAAVLDDLSYADDTWKEWPLDASDGDLAVLVQLVSDNKVKPVCNTIFHNADIMPRSISQ